MTRQKKEIIRKMNEIEESIYVDEALSCGNSPEGAYDHLYEAIYKLRDELAQLRHFTDAWSEFEFYMSIKRELNEELPF